MNILVYSWRDPRHPLAGGAEQAMHEHAKGWIGAGHSVTHFSSRFGESKKEEEIDGIKLVRGGNQSLGVQFAGFSYYLKHWKEFDLVIDEFHGLPFFTPLYVRTSKLAVIQETARKVWFLNPFKWPLNLIVGAIGYIVEPFIFQLYKDTKFMTGSVSAKKDVIGMGIPEKNITVVPHGVNISKFQISNFKLQIKTIIYLGVLSKDKGIKDAIKCFSILSKMREYKFWVIGKPETEKYGKYIKSLTEKMDVKKQTKFWGFVSQSKKFELLSKAHIMVNPSIHEGWGLVNLEANSVGTPVVAYSVSGTVDSVKDGVSGLLCKNNTPEDLAKNVEEILNDNKLYNKLQKGAISWSKNFNWEKSKKLSLNLIRRISNSH